MASKPGASTPTAPYRLQGICILSSNPSYQCSVVMKPSTMPKPALSAKIFLIILAKLTGLPDMTVLAPTAHIYTLTLTAKITDRMKQTWSYARLRNEVTDSTTHQSD